MRKTATENIEEIKKIVEENGGTAVIITENHNGNGRSEEEKKAKRIRMSNIIESIVAEIKAKEESIATISNGTTKLSICLNTNGDDREIRVGAEVKTPAISRYFFLTEILLQDNKKNINLRMIQKALKKNQELTDACEKFFFPETTIEFTNNQ